MSTYVIKSWHCTLEPQQDKPNIEIHGRAGGLLSWLFALLGISPIVSIHVYPDRVLFEQGSLAGSFRRIIPISKVSSTFYGYRKPWKEAVALGILFGAFTFGIGAIVGIVYYFLKKTMSLGFVEDSGVASSIDFQRSVIEGQRIDEQKAREACEIIEAFLKART
ncbi:MAG TPA: hypothetical protein PLO62_05935 [Candidatus Hydrogenedentes bacterium]|nr:hypothetical protein [Candidatus Hydrogenedentota bacterium]HOS03038.1 hypothetical protein [Candidatus Hydrogenedentota bacterium]